MPIGITTQSTSPYVLLDDREAPEADRTEFDIAPPTITQRGEIARAAAALTGGGPAEQLPIAVLICQACLRGWRKFRRDDGTEIAFATSRRAVLGVVGEYVTEEALSHLGVHHVLELGFEAFARAKLGADDAGK